MKDGYANRVFWASLLAFAVVSAAAGAGFLHPLDRRLLHLAQTRTSGTLDGIGAFFSTRGDVEYTAPALLVLALGLYLGGRRRLAWRAPVAFAATGVVELAMKFWLPTPRMPEETARSTDPHPIVEIAYPYPYPSGHMLRATFLAGLLWILWPNRAVRAAAILSLIGMAATRVYLGVHWASDIPGGLLLGVAGVAWIFRGEKGGSAK